MGRYASTSKTIKIRNFIFSRLDAKRVGCGAYSSKTVSLPLKYTLEMVKKLKDTQCCFIFFKFGLAVVTEKNGAIEIKPTSTFWAWLMPLNWFELRFIFRKYWQTENIHRFIHYFTFVFLPKYISNFPKPRNITQ